VVDEDNVRSDKVQIGHKVTVREGDEDEEVFELVGISEVNTLLGKISYESPIGSALLDKRPGEKVQVKTPGGVLEFTIIKIE
jgi:transcription elongation factor GreA